MLSRKPIPGIAKNTVPTYKKWKKNLFFIS